MKILLSLGRENAPLSFILSLYYAKVVKRARPSTTLRPEFVQNNQFHSFFSRIFV
jgi:hypothetical protein